jgi:hypothetical protein
MFGNNNEILLTPNLNKLESENKKLISDKREMIHCIEECQMLMNNLLSNL